MPEWIPPNVRLRCRPLPIPELEWIVTKAQQGTPQVWNTFVQSLHFYDHSPIRVQRAQILQSLGQWEAASSLWKESIDNEFANKHHIGEFPHANAFICAYHARNWAEVLRMGDAPFSNFAGHHSDHFRFMCLFARARLGDIKQACAHLLGLTLDVGKERTVEHNDGDSTVTCDFPALLRIPVQAVGRITYVDPRPERILDELRFIDEHPDCGVDGHAAIEKLRRDYTRPFLEDSYNPWQETPPSTSLIALIPELATWRFPGP